MKVPAFQMHGLCLVLSKEKTTSEMTSTMDIRYCRVKVQVIGCLQGFKAKRRTDETPTLNIKRIREVQRCKIFCTDERKL